MKTVGVERKKIRWKQLALPVARIIGEMSIPTFSREEEFYSRRYEEGYNLYDPVYHLVADY